MLESGGRNIASSPADGTPWATRAILLVVLALTAAVDLALMRGALDGRPAAAHAPPLWLFTALFVMRVAGQVLVAWRSPRWLPPMSQWNLVPYPVLLPIQLLLIALMVWIDRAFGAGDAPATARDAGLGTALLGFSAVYAAAMPLRYAIRMARRPDQRWFGGTIPMVFHLVLASYLFVLGRFHAAA